jgi:hypothetical protein
VGGVRCCHQNLARRLGPGSGGEMALNMMRRSFTAPTLRGFWRYWNAGTNYYLLLYCYRPVRRFLPHGPALLLTFVACGLLHDVVIFLPAALMAGTLVPFPFVTVWLLLVSLGVLVSEQGQWELYGLGTLQRVGAHTTFLVGTFAATFYLAKVV